MARLDDFVGEVKDPVLRQKLQDAVADLKRKQRFGLVFEEHIPEITALHGLPIHRAATVQLRNDPGKCAVYRVISVNGRGRASIEPVAGGEPISASARDLLTIKRFGDPVYPSLRSLGAIRRGRADKPYHAVIKGENYHALQLLLYLYEGQVDCLYLDPPYNTGARDWTYNNSFVDANDSYRHSKWLSFMEKRLRLAKRLLKPDGVVIITIDEHEVHHLAMLLERLFPEYQRPMVSIVISASGNNSDNFSRVEEYAFFCCPPIGYEVISGAATDFLPTADTDDDDDTEPLLDGLDEEEEVDHYVATARDGSRILVENARRRGKDSLRAARPSMFFPIFINETSKKVIRVGRPIPLDADPDFSAVNGLVPVWPVDANGDHRRWRWGYDEMVSAANKGELIVGKFDKQRKSWTINRVETKPDSAFKKLKTVWRHTSHAAGTHGSGLLQKYLGSSQTFSFPKSVYAVRDCLAAVVRTRRQALIVDFFAGSGTTLHATCLLNAADDGARRCILVTNNEVDPDSAAGLNGQGYFRGDPEFEAQGIFEKVTRPRCEAVVTGKRRNGTAVPGRHLDGRPHSKGFEENIEIYRLDYLDPDEVDLGYQFDAILPSLWLAAGGVGSREAGASKKHMSMPADSTYAVLFREMAFRKFKDQLGKRPEISHAWIVTDSEEAYAEMRSNLPRQLSVSMLYRDYLQNFRINTRQNL